MIRLIINGTEAELSADMNLDIVKQNPFLTKEGNYTYTISLDLRSKQNASIFSGIKKLDNESLYYDLHATLYENNDITCQGRAVILNKEDRTVSIQILSDNSELNYIFNQVKIRDLNLGSASFSMTSALENRDKIYPDVGFTFPMICGKYDDYKSSEEYNIYGNVSMANFQYNSTRDRMVPQPFVSHIIRLVLDELGYELTNSFMDSETKWRRLIMINPYKTDLYAKMLPDWTGTEFLTEIEHFFNGIFICSGSEVTFENVDVWYNRVGEVAIGDSDIIDAFDIDFVEEEQRETLGYDYTNVAYAGHNNHFWKAAKISNEFLEKCTIKDEAVVMENTDSFDIYSDGSSGLLCKPYSEKQWTKDSAGNDVEEVVPGSRHLSQVHQFQNSVKDESKPLLVLKIFPAEIFNTHEGIYVPTVELKNIEVGNQRFWEALDKEKEDDKIDYMNVAFYLGNQRNIIRYDGTPGSSAAPQCSTTYHQFTRNANLPFVHYLPNAFSDYDQSMTLELTGNQGRCSQELATSFKWDSEHLYKINFLTRSNLDVRKIFVIKGKKYICKQLTYSIEKCRMNRICKGEFYRIIEQ